MPGDIGSTTEAILKETKRVTPENAAEVRHLRLQVLDPVFRFVEGESIGVLVPRPHPSGNPYHLRRYSIANARRLPLDEGIGLDLLVRRCFCLDEISGERLPGIASNYLCDARPEDRITISGPYPSPFTMPLDKRSNLLMIGTGTGVAPFRAFAELLYERYGDWIGEVRLFYGGRSGLDLMYANDDETSLADYYDRRTFKAFKALATLPTMTSSQALERGLAENAREVWALIQQPNTYVFLAGLGKVAKVLDQVMTEWAGSAEAWRRFKEGMIEERRWSELIYDR